LEKQTNNIKDLITENLSIHKSGAHLYFFGFALRQQENSEAPLQIRKQTL
jgi:hypothetical protein